MIDRGGCARLTILAPPWAVRRKYAAYSPLMIVGETLGGSDRRWLNAFSFGVVAMEVRPVYVAAYSVGGGEMDNLTSA